MLQMNYRTHDRDTVNATRSAYREALAALETAYRETRDGTPAATLCRASELAPPSMVFAALASVVHGCEWDGRISPRSAAWAVSVHDCLDESTLSLFGLYTNIHRAHLDQLATAARNYHPITEA